MTDRLSPTRNFLVSLSALSGLPDETLQAWGREFDWGAPLLHDEDGSPLGPDAGQLLLLHKDERLRQLLLRSDLYAPATGKKNLVEHHELTLMMGLLALAYEKADLASIDILEKDQRCFNFSDSLDWEGAASPLGGWLRSKAGTDKLVKCLDRIQSRAKTMFDRKPMGLSNLYKGKPAAREEQFWKGWHHRITVVALLQGAPQKHIDLLRSRSGDLLTRTMFDSALHGKNLEVVASLAAEFRGRGQWDGEPIYMRNNSPSITTLGCISQNVLSVLGERHKKDHDDAAWRLVAKSVLRGDFEVDDLFHSDPMPELRKMYKLWDMSVLEMVEVSDPVPRITEVVEAFGASDEVWQRRIVDKLPMINCPATDIVSLLGSLITQNPMKPPAAPEMERIVSIAFARADVIEHLSRYPKDGNHPGWSLFKAELQRVLLDTRTQAAPAATRARGPRL